MENVISDELLEEFIGGVAFRKRALLECFDVLINKEEQVIDEVAMIVTFNSPNDNGRCSHDELMIVLRFPGYEEEVRRLKYPEFFKLIKNGFEAKGHYYSKSDQIRIQGIIDMLEKSYFE